MDYLLARVLTRPSTTTWRPRKGQQLYMCALGAASVTAIRLGASTLGNIVTSGCLHLAPLVRVVDVGCQRSVQYCWQVGIALD